MPEKTVDLAKLFKNGQNTVDFTQDKLIHFFGRLKAFTFTDQNLYYLINL